MAPNPDNQRPLGICLSIFGPVRCTGGREGEINAKGASLLLRTLDPVRDIIEKPFHCPMKECRERPEYQASGGYASPDRLLDHLHRDHFLLSYKKVRKDPMSEVIEYSTWKVPEWERLGWAPVELAEEEVLQCQLCSSPTLFGKYSALLIHHCVEHLKLPPDSWFREDTNAEASTSLMYDSPLDINQDLLPAGARRQYHSTLEGSPQKRILQKYNYLCYYPDCPKQSEAFAGSGNRVRFKKHLLQHDRTCDICGLSELSLIRSALDEENCNDSFAPRSPSGESPMSQSPSTLFHNRASLGFHQIHEHPDPDKLRKVIFNLLRMKGFGHEVSMAMCETIPDKWDNTDGVQRVSQLGKEILAQIGWPHFFICPEDDCLAYFERKSYLRNHSNTHKNVKKRLRCSRECGFESDSPKRHKRHEESTCSLLPKKSQRVTCSRCGSSYASKKSLTVHLRSCGFQASSVTPGGSENPHEETLDSVIGTNVSITVDQRHSDVATTPKSRQESATDLAESRNAMVEATSNVPEDHSMGDNVDHKDEPPKESTNIIDEILNEDQDSEKPNQNIDL